MGPGIYTAPWNERGHLQQPDMDKVVLPAALYSSRVHLVRSALHTSEQLNCRR